MTSQEPFDMKNVAGDADFREIPFEISISQLKITHNYYDYWNADKDINIVFPIEKIRLLQQMEEVGQVNHRH